LAGISITTLALTVLCVQVAGLFASDRVGGEPALSRQDMEAFVGGITCKNCDDCHMLEIPNVLTCARSSTDCDLTKCVDNTTTTYGCTPDTGDSADGCNTKAGTQPLHKHYYNTPEAGKTCVLEKGAGPEYKLWRRIWYGCDTSPDYTCSDHKIRKACERSNCPNPTFDKITEQGTQYICGC
jgi:hypothetical protein